MTSYYWGADSALVRWRRGKHHDDHHEKSLSPEKAKDMSRSKRQESYYHSIVEPVEEGKEGILVPEKIRVMKANNTGCFHEEIVHDENRRLGSMEQVVDYLSSRGMTETLMFLVGVIKKELALHLTQGPEYFEPSRFSESKEYYPKQVGKSHRSYFIAEKEAQALQDHRELRKKNLENLYTVVEGKTSHTFDGTSQGTKREWLSILSRNEDDFAKVEFAAKMERRASKFNKLSKSKLDWVRHNGKVFSNQTKRLAHLLAVVQSEQKREVAREMQLCDSSLSMKQHRDLCRKIARERGKASDSIMNLLHDYGFISSAKMAEYLKSIESAGTENNKDKSSDPPFGDHGQSSISTTVEDSRRGNFRTHETRRIAAISQKQAKKALVRRQRESLRLRQRERAEMMGTRPTSSAMSNGFSLSNPSIPSLSSHSRFRQSTTASKSLGRSHFTRQSASPGVRHENARSQSIRAYGGWGQRISAEGERILHEMAKSGKQRVPARGKELGVHRLDPRKSQYSFLFGRGIPRNGS